MTRSPRPLVAGLDGCRGGWVVVRAPLAPVAGATVERIEDLRRVLAELDTGCLAAAAIDIPIGLPRAGPRQCDREARGYVGPRRSSVFPAPPRELVASELTTFDAARDRCRALTSRGLTMQSFGILPKIREVDRLMTPARQRHLVEVHPEVSFTALAGAPMRHHKATPDGRAERLAALRIAFPDIERLAGLRLPGTKRDDVLDALVAAWSAQRWVRGAHHTLGAGQMDDRGLRMEIIA